VIVMSVPPITIGLKSELEVVPKVVLPAKMTVAPVCRDLREMVEEAGAEIPDSRILEQDLTAEEMLAYAVTVQVVPPDPDPPAAVVLALVVVVAF
jgi:hypothetical protein